LISGVLACGGLCLALAAAASPAGRSVVLWRKKETLKLADFGLSNRECEFVLAYLSGKSMKQIASDNGVRSSTVRNTFSNAYAKLGIIDSHELRALGERFNVE
jgi:DNA-binding NarL/FixJ family response regulator